MATASKATKATTKRTTPPKAKPKAPALTAREILDMKVPNEDRLVLCLDSRLVAARTAAQLALGQAENKLAVSPDNSARKAAVKKAQAAYDKDEAAALAKTGTFKFQAIARTALRDMVRAHPPTVEETASRLSNGLSPTGDSATFSMETFPPYLVAATLKSPAFTIEEMQELWESDDWSDGETDVLFLRAWNVNKAFAQ